MSGHQRPDGFDEQDRVLLDEGDKGRATDLFFQASGHLRSHPIPEAFAAGYPLDDRPGFFVRGLIAAPGQGIVIAEIGGHLLAHPVPSGAHRL